MNTAGYAVIALSGRAAPPEGQKTDLGLPLALQGARVSGERIDGKPVLPDLIIVVPEVACLFVAASWGQVLPRWRGETTRERWKMKDNLVRKMGNRHG